MLPTNALVVFSMVAVLAFGAPQVAGSIPEGAEASGEVITVTLFMNPNWEEPSQGFTYNIDGRQCYNLVGTDYNDHVGSIQVPSGYRCRLWQSHDCNQKSTGDIWSPGAQEVRTDIGLSSFKCYRN
ncbi:hypothetical protein BFW01_g8947 [Lasiodiplodia theobromae]|nr:hypothetical protein BFW01_g8947 [Lasiodiplodia theobromae]